MAAVAEVARIEVVLADCGATHVDPTRWQRELTTAAAALDDDLATAAERDAATRLTLLQAATEEAMAASGFADATEARAAAMDGDDLDRRERLLAEWDAAVRDLAAVLNEPEHDLPEMPPDTDQIDAAAAQARALSHDLSNCHAAMSVHRDSAAASIAAMGSRQTELDAAIRAAEVATTVLDRCAGRMMPRIPLRELGAGRRARTGRRGRQRPSRRHDVVDIGCSGRRTRSTPARAPDSISKSQTPTPAPRGERRRCPAANGSRRRSRWRSAWPMS